MRTTLIAVMLLVLPVLGACGGRAGSELARRGDEIVVCGRYFHTGAPVVLWTDPGGYDAYRTEKRFVPWEQAAWRAKGEDGKATGHPEAPARYGVRFAAAPDRGGLSDEEFERIRGGGWDLPLLQRTVDQFVLHYDVCGTSRTCFRVLQDMRGLSVHFMLDIDGTIYQTLDVKERAWHATTSNDRAVGIEIANIGAYRVPKAGEELPKPLRDWYEPDMMWWEGAEDAPKAERVWSEPTRITIPPTYGDGGVRTPEFVGRPARPGPIRGTVQGQELLMHDLTPEQYDSLIKLTATLCTVLPRIRCDYPRDGSGELLLEQLSEERLGEYRGVLGHWHIQKNKIDPGPALDWDRVIEGARQRIPSRMRAG